MFVVSTYKSLMFSSGWPRSSSDLYGRPRRALVASPGPPRRRNRQPRLRRHRGGTRGERLDSFRRTGTIHYYIFYCSIAGYWLSSPKVTILVKELITSFPILVQCFYKPSNSSLWFSPLFFLLISSVQEMPLGLLVQLSLKWPVTHCATWKLTFRVLTAHLIYGI